MSSFMFYDRTYKHNKRDLFRWNLGGQERNNMIQGNNNQFTITDASEALSDETLLQKTGHQLGKVIEGGADLVISPARWLVHMLYYLIFGTIFMVCVLIIYCYVRNQISRYNPISTSTANVPKATIMEAMELAALRRSLPDV